MFLELICVILNIFGTINGDQMTQYWSENTGFDILKKQDEPINVQLKGSTLAPTIETSEIIEPIESHYSLIAPGTLKSNCKYTVVVSLHNAMEPCIMKISISGALFNATENFTLQRFESKIVDFFPSKLDHDDDYTLKAEGVAGCRFRQEKKLLAAANSGPKIYIQTDKTIYKPEDLIRFRVLFLDEHTKPLGIKEPVRIEILDAKENIVKSFKDVQFTTGVYTNSFPLSERPLMGSWSIRVSVSGKYSLTRSKTIRVEKYVLPKFSVHIKTPKHVVTSDAFIKAIIYGKYTFGKYVQGVAVVKLWKKFSNEILQEKAINVRTLARLKLPLANSDNLPIGEILNLDVALNESSTGITQKESIEIILHNQRYNIFINDEDFEFKGFEPYRLKAHIQHWNGAAVVDNETAVVLEHGGRSYETYLDGTGVAYFEFKNQPNSGYSIYFKDSTFYLPSLLASTVEEDNSSVYYCKLQMIDKRFQLGATAKILVSSSEDIPHLVYTIVGHGNIIRMQHIKLPPHQTSYAIHIEPTIEMIPISYIHVHYSAKGIFRSNEMELVFPKQFENKVSLAAPKEAKPGQEITLELKAQPQSIVGILAVELGVHLLDPSYDLQREVILNELQEDKSHIYSQYIQDGEFLQCGLVVLTNVQREPPKHAYFGYGGGFSNSFGGGIGNGFHSGIGFGGVRPASVGYGSHGATPMENLRTYFPEVWIFQNLQINSTTTKMSYKLPDSITSWSITAFAVNDATGLGIVDGPTDVIAIKRFFISLSLPYSVKRGEIVVVNVLVFNYDSQSLDTSVTMFNNDNEFEFMESNEDGTRKSKDQQTKTTQSIISSNDGRVFLFYIKPTKVGQISLHITASNKLYTDAVQQQLKVESEGITQNVNKAVFVYSGNNSSIRSTSLRFSIPADVEPSASEVSLTVGGDYIVPTLDNLQNLVEIPTGCGEQNMISFAPNILVLQYLKINGGYAKEKKLIAKIRSNIDIGYQQQLSYRHFNGGFSVFGQSVDDEASTWLTAYVIRFFIKASKFASIERRIIDTGLQYLSKAQLNDGSFPYTGYLFEPVQQNQYGLTAFILATFMEDRMYARKYKQVIDKGLQFLTKNIDDIQDAYALSIVSFVLQIAKNSNVHKVWEKLQVYRKQENDLIWWSAKDNFTENSVEITAYVLMTLLDTGIANDYVPILEWLLTQRNDKGGFLSTQDTVVGLQALVKFNEKFTYDKNINFNIKYAVEGEQGEKLQRGEFKVKADNFLIRQKHMLPATTRDVSLEMSGAGSALVQLSHRYNLLNAATQISPMISAGSKNRKKYGTPEGKERKVEYFVIEPKANILKNSDLELDICFIYKNKTNMVILEINLPSGFRTDEETLADVENNAFVQRTETQKECTKVILYLDRLTVGEENCVTILAYETNQVLNRKKVPVVMYDYYNSGFYNSTFYTI